MSFKDRLTILEKNLTDLSTNIKTYHTQIDVLKQNKQGFQKSFDSRNAEIKKNITIQLQRVFEELKRHLAHHRNENNRIQTQIAQLRQEKEYYQNFLRKIREKLDEIERQVGQS